MRHGVLPGLFAWPAGLGDIAIGITATVGGDVRADRPPQPRDWPHVRGVEPAGASGIRSSRRGPGSGRAPGIVPGLVTEVTTAPMSQAAQLVLIPAYLVPLFIMLHLAAHVSDAATGVVDGSRARWPHVAIRCRKVKITSVFT